MREIKFRTWDIESKTIRNNAMPRLTGYGAAWGINGEFDSMGEYEFMQYTGIKDEYGFMIYEGDICIFNHQKYKVVHECGSFGLASNNDINYAIIQAAMDEFTENEFSGCCNDNFISLWEIYWNFSCEENQINEIEVIGNIYENAELLERSEDIHNENR